MPDDEVPVLIVGGSLVGLTTAMLLGHHGVPSLAVERHAGTAIHPRAGHFQLRTMELLRQLGLEDRVRAKSLETYSPTGGIVAVESLAGRELATYVQELNEGVEGFSPTRRVFINQDALEPLLRERALELGATVRNRTEAVAIEQDDDGATVTLRDLDSGDEREVRARYVVAADGSRSPMRARLGIAMRGYGQFSRSITIYFRADCSELLRDRNQGVIYVHNPALRGFFRLDRTGGKGFLVINTVGEDVTQDSAVDVQAGLTEERALEYLRTAIGTELPMEIVDVANWQAEANWAERLRDRRVFLAGDAAHVVPPNGGFGGNTGVQDALNLAWKLALVVKGDAGPGLLDSYEAERLPLIRLTVQQAYTRYATRVVPERGTDGVEPPIPDIELEIGLVMRSARDPGRGRRRRRPEPAAVGARRPARHPRPARRARRRPLDARSVRLAVRRPPPCGRRRRRLGARRGRVARHRRRLVRGRLRPVGRRGDARAPRRRRRLARPRSSVPRRGLARARDRARSVGGLTTSANVTLAAWVVLELGVRVREAVQGRGGRERDRGTRVLIALTLGAAIGLAAAAPSIAPSLRMPGFSRVLGVIVMWLGLATRVWAIAALGAAFRTTVEVDPGQTVVSSGPYKWIRHPSYTGLLLVVAGFGLAVGNWLALAVALLLPLPGILWRIHVEEAELERVLGAAYGSYRAKTTRLIPGLW